MSDYMFMLESHLTPEQNRVVAEVSAAAAHAHMNLFLTGGAVRDMLGGFPVRDLDFTVEGNPAKIIKDVIKHTGAETVAVDDNRKRTQLLFGSGVTAEISMARQERYPKPGGKPQVTPATIHEDLRGRDFTINAIALSLNKGSRGLLLDPTNGLSELDRKELRTTGNYTLYDNPIRLLRMLRFRARLGYQISERTQQQYENAREAEVEKYITPPALLEEVKHIAQEINQPELIQALDASGLLKLLSPALSGAKLNIAGLTKLQKARQLVPFGANLQTAHMPLFLAILAEKLSPKEKQAMADALAISKSDAEQWNKLDAKASKLEKELASAKLQKPSQIYRAAAGAAGEQLLYLLAKSQQRLVLDRIKNFFGKYLPTAMEVTDAAISGATPGSPKFGKLKAELIAQRLDARPKKVAPPPEPPAPAPTGPGRRSI